MDKTSVGVGMVPPAHLYCCPLPSPQALGPHLRDEQLQEVGFVPQRIVHQAVAEGHHAMGEVVLGQPCHHPLLLHVGSARHIDDEVAQVLPVPVGERRARCPKGFPTSCPASPHMGCISDSSGNAGHGSEVGHG